MNPILFILLSIVLIGVALYLVALPILRHTRQLPVGRVPGGSEQEHLDELVAQREAAFQALRELSFDHRVGKITDDDFAAFEVGLKQAAADALRALDQWEAEADRDLDSALEQAISLRRRTLAPAEGEDQADRLCPKCGQPASAGDRFCAGCGSPLDVQPTAGEVALRCTRCGQELAGDDKFCAGCGQTVARTIVAEKP